MNIVFAIMMLLHIFCCVIVFFLINSGILDVHKYMLPIVVLLPIWGLILLFILHFQVSFDKDGKKDIQVEKMQLESEIYKSVNVEAKKNSDSIIALEEALIVNSAKERRELIMDILNDNPREYIEFLQKAGNNDDTEVVHYAVTAMVEISKDNAYMLQEYERKYSVSPDDYELLTEYSDFLWDCLCQGLMQGQVEIMNRNQLNELYEKKIKIDGKITDYSRYATNCIKLNDFTRAGIIIQKMAELWPDSEEVLFLKLEYYASLSMGEEITKILEEAENKNVYLSSEAKEVIAFWKS